MKYMISTGYSVVTNIERKSGITISFTASVDSDSAKEFDKYGDAMTACIGINNLIGKPIFKVMPLNK